jgi:hypothetical protein
MLCVFIKIVLVSLISLLRFKVIQALLNFFFTFVEVVSARGRG